MGFVCVGIFFFIRWQGWHAVNPSVLFGSFLVGKKTYRTQRALFG